MLISVVYLYSDNNNIKTNKMKTFNQELTLEQAIELFKFKGETIFPKTQHNIKMMALAIDNHLKTLRK